MKTSAMEVYEAPADRSDSFVHPSDWLQSTVKGVNEKMKAILTVLEEYDSPLQNAEIYGRKEKITELVQDLCTSYHALAEEHASSKTVSIGANNSGSSPCSNDGSVKDDIDSNPESTVEDADIGCDDTMNELEDKKRFADNSGTKDRNTSEFESVSSDGLRFKFSKLVEENTQIQVELIRRNSEKRETIRKLQNQVNRLKSENDTLQRTLRYYDHKQQDIQENSPRRKAMLLEKFSEVALRSLIACHVNSP